MKITIHDTRKCGYCISATKRWMEDHDFDFRDFVKNGLEWDRVKHIDEEVVARSYEQALIRTERESA